MKLPAGLAISRFYPPAAGRGSAADLYVPSARPYRGLTALEYPLHDWTATVTTCGRICYRTRKIKVSQVFAGQLVGVRQVGDHIWLVTFMDYDLGYWTTRRAGSNRLKTPFGPKVLPM